MSSFWTGTSNKKLTKAELDLVKFSGIDENEFHSYPIYFEFSEKDWKENNNEDADVNGSPWN
jgi:hypothetical protein